MELKWFFIALAVAALSIGAVNVSENLGTGPAARADAVKACVDSNKYTMADCARLK